MKKVVIDGIISALQSYGGITVYFKEILKNIDNDSYQVFEYDKNNIQFENSQLLTARTFERYRKSVLPNYDFSVFHSSYYRVPDNNTIPIVTTVHDFTYEKYMSGLARMIHVHQKYNAIKKSDAVICISNNTAEDLLKYCPIDESKIHVIHNGVSDSYHRIETSDNQHGNNVLFVGARKGYKNFELAVRTLHLLPELTLEIVGGGAIDSQEKNMLEELIPGRYKVHGHIDECKLNELYNSAFCLLYPSEYEGFGIPVLEAMGAGCPVIAVDSSSIPEVAGDAAILVNVAGVNNFKEAIQELMFSRQKYCTRGLEQVTKFSWSKTAMQTQSIYNKFR